jgi:hypothetical protein
MGKRPTDPPVPTSAPGLPSVAPEAALAEGLRIMLPLVRFLLRNGVPYGAFADALKTVFVDAARRELLAGGMPVTQSSLSVLSGVHRKDVRAFTQDDTGRDVSPPVPLASQVFTRWLSDPAYRKQGKPRTIPRTGPAPSFDALARAVSTDVHPRTVLDELVRLGIVKLDGPDVVPLVTGFVPLGAASEVLGLVASNAADHLAAAIHNLAGAEPRFLEQSVFANGMTAESAEKLAAVAREAWDRAFRTMVDAATERVQHDAEIEGNHRVRFGAYFYSEPPESAAPTLAPRKRTGRSNRESS